MSKLKILNVIKITSNGAASIECAITLTNKQTYPGRKNATSTSCIQLYYIIIIHNTIVLHYNNTQYNCITL